MMDRPTLVHARAPRATAGRSALPLLLLLCAAPSAAQIPSASPAALGMGENATASARGYHAIAWNPAGLVLPGSGTTTAQLLTVRGSAGVGPITLADLVDAEGRTLGRPEREQWLARVRGEGAQDGVGSADVIWAAMHSGWFGLQVSSSARATHRLTPGAAELLLLGNANDDGTARTLDLAGSSVEAEAYTTGAVAFAVPVALAPGRRLALGVSAKYTIGHYVLRSRASTGAATADPLAIGFAFPVIYSPSKNERGGNNLKTGGGFGMDVGAGLDVGQWTFGVALQNVVNGFAWDESLLRYRPMEVVFDGDRRASSLDSGRLEDGPAELRALLDEQTFGLSSSAGVQYRHSPRLRAAADFRRNASAGMHARDEQHVGAGVEVKPVDWTSLYFGAAHVRLDELRSGPQVSAGLGLHLGTFTVSAAAARRSYGTASEHVVMVSLLSHAFENARPAGNRR